MAARRVIDRIEREASRHRLPGEKADEANLELARASYGTVSEAVRGATAVLRQFDMDLARPPTLGTLSEAIEGGEAVLAIGYAEDFEVREIRNAELVISHATGDIGTGFVARIR